MDTLGRLSSWSHVWPKWFNLTRAEDFSQIVLCWRLAFASCGDALVLDGLLLFLMGFSLLVLQDWVAEVFLETIKGWL